MKFLIHFQALTVAGVQVKSVTLLWQDIKNMYVYLYFQSSPDIEMTQEVEIFPRGRQGPHHHTVNIMVADDLES